MRFLTDQDVYALSTALLAKLGHDVVTVAQLGLAQAEDAELLRIADEQQRVLVTEIGISAILSLSKARRRGYSI